LFEKYEAGIVVSFTLLAQLDMAISADPTTDTFGATIQESFFA
jgi:hypothetical protein